jgi:hypothetical protein
MPKVSRRVFIGILASSAVASAGLILDLDKRGTQKQGAITTGESSGNTTTVTTTKNGSTSVSGVSTSVKTLGAVPIVKLIGISTYQAISSSGDVIFSGSCSEGSGTCGIYEAMTYVKDNYGIGRVELLGSFYPVGSPSPVQGVQLYGDATIYLSPTSLPFVLSSQRAGSIKLLWYQDVGIVNKLLSKTPSFSLSPYVYFPSMASSLFFANGNQSLGTPSSFTVAAWVNGGQNNNAGYVVTYGSLNAGISWTIQYGYGYVIFNTPYKTVQYSYDSSPFHVAVTYDNGVANMYVNGDPVTSSSCTISYVNPSYLWISNFPAKNQQSGISPTSAFPTIENVQFYNKALSPSQVKAISSPTADPVDPSISFWGLYRYIFYVGDLITGIGFQRMGGPLEGGVF